MTKVELETKRLELATKIRAKRESKDITQEDLAKLVNVNRIEMSRIEAGHVKNIDTYIRVARALGMDVQITVSSTAIKALSKYE
jgi:transcriptional regulator with XRE-family HTH domain